MTTTTSSPTGTLEHRTFATQLSTRDLSGMEGVVEGYAATTGSAYDMGSYEETISRGAFSKTLSKNPDVQLLLNHEGLPLARTTNNSLTLREDDTGLHFSALLDKSDPTSQALLRKIGSGLMDQCSFAFRTVSQDWSADRSERKITEVSLDRGDVSVVNFGANPLTPVSARSRGRRGTSNLNLYQARARAAALRERDIRIRHAQHPNLAYYRARAYALGVHDD
jgi:HK97 family phage prohead protease